MQNQKLEQNQKLRFGPQQIHFLNLLQTPLSLLNDRIEKEMEENPVIEDAVVEEDILEEEGRNHIGFNYSKKHYPLNNLSEKSTSLADFLHTQIIGLHLEEKTTFLVNYLIDSLDENGFLNIDISSVANDLLISFNMTVLESELKQALSIVQQLEPVGVGAKNLQSCLLIQLENKPTNEITSLAIQAISSFYKDFANKNFDFLLKNLSVSSEKLKLIYKEVERLNPIPSRGFSRESNVDPVIIPDFIISIINGVPTLQLNNNFRKNIKISNKYRDMLKETNDEETKKFLTQKIESAEWFKSAIIERENTLKKVMNAILNFQYDYFKTGNEKEIKPMKLSDIAEIVKMDISTISRVANKKYVETDFDVFLLKEVFSEGYKKIDGEVISTKEIKSALKELVENEDKNSPLTDEKLRDMLEKNEYDIARRTVTKYRESLGIPISKLRKRL